VRQLAVLTRLAEFETIDDLTAVLSAVIDYLHRCNAPEVAYEYTALKDLVYLAAVSRTQSVSQLASFLSATLSKAEMAYRSSPRHSRVMPRWSQHALQSDLLVYLSFGGGVSRAADVHPTAAPNGLFLGPNLQAPLVLAPPPLPKATASYAAATRPERSASPHHDRDRDRVRDADRAAPASERDRDRDRDYRMSPVSKVAVYVTDPRTEKSIDALALYCAFGQMGECKRGDDCVHGPPSSAAHTTCPCCYYAGLGKKDHTAKVCPAAAEGDINAQGVYNKLAKAFKTLIDRAADNRAERERDDHGYSRGGSGDSYRSRGGYSNGGYRGGRGNGGYGNGGYDRR